MVSWLLHAYLITSLGQCLAGGHKALHSKRLTSTTPDWDSLKRQVGGRLFSGVPFAQPCFSQFDSPECLAIRQKYTDEVMRSGNFGAYIQAQWETCQKSGEQCLLDQADPNNIQPTLSTTCKAGSVPSFYIDVRTDGDVAAAFKFSKQYSVPLVIKNSGHDYKGRSSGPNSLALWTHNLKNMTYHPDFVPTGCSSEPRQAVTMGAGVQWGEAYGFADANGVTLVGGSDQTVGAAGGWLQGGGHGALSPSLGLGVDRVLEFKIVTPDGKLRIANECQNTDLFWALRGGGGSTFGVVLEATSLASPQVTLQTLILTFPPNTNLTTELWTIMAENQVKWAEEGFGGFSMANAAIFLNPKLSNADAQASLAPLLEFGQKLQASDPSVTLLFTELQSWKQFFDLFVSQFVAITGENLAIASRLISKSLFETAQGRSSLVSGLLEVEKQTPGLIILISPPTAFEAAPNSTSITPAWRTSLYHVTTVSTWNWNATLDEKAAAYTRVSTAMDNLRKITPGSGAYQNEADVHEPNHEVAFWGSNYPALLRIKQKYDPDHLLDCWHCVGSNQSSSRFRCYV